MDLEGFVESRSRSFTDLWPVAPEYRIVDGHVCPLVAGKFIQQGTFHSFKGCRRYLPMAWPEIPRELAKVASGRESDVLDFVRRYGVLGYARAWRLEELVGAWLLEGGHEEGDPTLHGDPVSWVVAHAQTVRLVLELMGHLDDATALRAFLDTLKVTQVGHPEHYVYRVARRGDLYAMEMRSVSRGKHPLEVARHMIETILNRNLTGVSRVLIVEHQDNGHQGFASLFEPRNLLDCAYWHLADAAIGGWVRRCANPRCGAFFVAKSEKVKYCPPPMGNQGVSPCMNRHKQQVHRDKDAAVRKATQNRHRTRRGKTR
jgi:hypothetical protein